MEINKDLWQIVFVANLKKVVRVPTEKHAMMYLQFLRRAMEVEYASAQNVYETFGVEQDAIHSFRPRALVCRKGLLALWGAVHEKMNNVSPQRASISIVYRLYVIRC